MHDLQWQVINAACAYKVHDDELIQKAALGVKSSMLYALSLHNTGSGQMSFVCMFMVLIRALASIYSAFRFEEKPDAMPNLQ